MTTKAYVIDSPDAFGCHGREVLASLQDTWSGSHEHCIIDPECDGRASFESITNYLRDLADMMRSGDLPTGPINVSWGAGKSKGVIYAALRAFLLDSVGQYDRSHAQYVYEEGGGIVVRSSGNDDYDDAVGATAAGLYSIAVGAYNTGVDVIYDFANRWNGLLVDYWADGKAPTGGLGTSFAAPRITGAITLLMDRGFSIWEAKQALYIDSIPVSSNGHGDLALLNEGALQSRTSPVPIGTSETILAAYVVGLGRRPDQAGWTYWTQYALDYGNEAAVRALWFGAKSNGDWQLHQVPVARRIQCYYHLLGREADDGGMAWWLRQVARGNYGGIHTDPDSGFQTAIRDFYAFDWNQFSRDFDGAAQAEGGLLAADLLYD